MVVARDVVTITKEAAEMVNYREILRLSNDPKNGQRSIAAALHCSRVQDTPYKVMGIVTNHILRF